MSDEQARAFLERLKTDEDFNAKVFELEDLDERIRFIHAEGFDCSNEEIEKMYVQMTDAEMAGVAGGVIGTIFQEEPACNGKCSYTCYQRCHISGYGCRGLI